MVGRHHASQPPELANTKSKPTKNAIQSPINYDSFWQCMVACQLSGLIIFPPLRTIISESFFLLETSSSYIIMTFQTTATIPTSTMTAANAAVLFFTGLCVIGQATAFTSTNSVPSSLSSSFHFSNKQSASAAASASIVQRNMVYNYDGEDEKVGPFHCSGELEVDENSARRLEHFFHSDDKPATAMTTATFSSSSSLAGIDTSSVASFENDTTDIDRILLEMGIDFDAEQDPNMPFHYSRESTMDERIERMREVLQIDFEAEQDNGRELASQEQQNGNDASTYSWQ